MKKFIIRNGLIALLGCHLLKPSHATAESPAIYLEKATQAVDQRVGDVRTSEQKLIRKNIDLLSTVDSKAAFAAEAWLLKGFNDNRHLMNERDAEGYLRFYKAMRARPALYHKSQDPMAIELLGKIGSSTRSYDRAMLLSSKAPQWQHALTAACKSQRKTKCGKIARQLAKQRLRTPGAFPEGERAVWQDLADTDALILGEYARALGVRAAPRRLSKLSTEKSLWFNVERPRAEESVKITFDVTLLSSSGTRVSGARIAWGLSEILDGVVCRLEEGGPQDMGIGKGSYIVEENTRKTDPAGTARFPVACEVPTRMEGLRDQFELEPGASAMTAPNFPAGNCSVRVRMSEPRAGCTIRLASGIQDVAVDARYLRADDLPLIEKALAGNDSHLRFLAAFVLERKWGGCLECKTDVLRLIIRVLRNEYKSDTPREDFVPRSYLIAALPGFGVDAREALDVLRLAQKDPEDSNRLAAKDAIQKISRYRR